MALHEKTVMDEDLGRIVNDNLADYLIPVHADMPRFQSALDAICGKLVLLSVIKGPCEILGAFRKRSLSLQASDPISRPIIVQEGREIISFQRLKCAPTATGDRARKAFEGPNQSFICHNAILYELPWALFVAPLSPCEEQANRVNRREDFHR